MFRDLKNYILEADFKITYVDEKVSIVNYQNIDHFDDNKIIVKYQKGKVIIEGGNLIISKMLDDEMLISGSIKNIGFQ